MIDDGSTDDSLRIIKTFGDRIRWETGTNRGGGAARNKGIELSQGELIQFLDADDLLYPDKLAVMVPIAVSVGRSTIVVSDWEQVRRDGSVEVKHLDLLPSAEDHVVFCLENQIQTASPLHRRDYLERVSGFSCTLPCSQERDLHLRLVAQGLRLKRVGKVLHLVRRRTHSVSSDYIRVLDQHECILLGIRDLLQANGDLTPVRRTAIAKALAVDARRYIRRGLNRKAEHYFQLAEEVNEGGSASAFGQWSSRALVRVLGAARAERVIQSLIRWRRVKLA